MTPQSFSYWETKEWLQASDLLIVGGGIVGASTALFFKQKFPDHDVLILDKGMVPEGASTRNAGFACIGSISEHLADMKTVGEEIVFERIKRRWDGLNLLKETMGEKEIGYEHTGGYEIFTNKDKFDKCRDQINYFNRHLQERIDQSEIYKSTEYEGYPAIINRAEGAINSGRMMMALHKRLLKLGVRTWWNCAVDSIEHNSVILQNGVKLNSERIVLATNGFTKRLINLPIKPARGYVFITKPMDSLKWRGTFHFDEGYIYFRNLNDRLLLGGGRNLAIDDEETDEFGVNEKIRDYLVKFAAETLRLPAVWVMDQEWSGIMGMTENKEPIIKQIHPTIWIAAGLSGMGIAVGMEVARNLVELLDQ